jgi:hypothetical protein
MDESAMTVLMHRSRLLQEQGRQLAAATAEVFGRLAETEDTVARAMQNRLATASERREHLETLARLARGTAEQLRDRRRQLLAGDRRPNENGP